MTVLTFANHKGGTGKTTSAMCVAAALGISGHRVLAIDLDPQCFLTRMFGVSDPPDELSALILFEASSRLTSEACRPLKWLDLLPGSPRAPKVLRTLNKASDVLWVRETLHEARLEYDFIIIDTAAAVTAFSLGALVAADVAIIPVAPEYQPVVGAEQCFTTVRTIMSKLNPDMSPPKFLLTQVDARKKSHNDYRSYLRQKYGNLVFRRVIRTSASLSHSFGDGTTIFDHQPGSRGAIDYANLTDELLQVLKAVDDVPPASKPTAEMSNVSA